MSSVITFYICTKWIKFTQLFILGFISSNLYLEDMSRERKHWLQQFHMIFIYCVWCHLWVSASFGHNSGRLACSLVKQLHLCSQALADSSQSKKHIGRPLYKAQGKLHTFIKRLSSRRIKCLPGFAGIDCVYDMTDPLPLLMMPTRWYRPRCLHINGPPESSWQRILKSTQSHRLVVKLKRSWSLIGQDQTYDYFKLWSPDRHQLFPPRRIFQSLQRLVHRASCTCCSALFQPFKQNR